jgi:hypothetical protein
MASAKLIPSAFAGQQEYFITIPEEPEKDIVTHRA